MNPLDKLIASSDHSKRTPQEIALTDQSAKGVLDQLRAMGVDTDNADQMRGALAGVVLLSWVRAELGQLTAGTIGAAIMNLVDLQPPKAP